MATRALTRPVVLALALARMAVGALTGRRRAPASPRRVLVAHHLLLGDTLMLTPLLAKLRHNLGDAEVVMTVPKAIHPLYRRRPYGVVPLPYDPHDAHTLPAIF